MQWLSDQGNSAATDGWSESWRRKLMEKLSLKMTKDRWVPDWYIIPSRDSFFFFFLKTLGFSNGKEADEKRGGTFSLLGHGVCGRSGQRHFWPGKGYAYWGARTHTHTQIDPDTRPYAVTFYLSFLFIIVRQCKRQTGKGYDVKEQEFVATKRSGNTSSGGHFSCG